VPVCLFSCAKHRDGMNVRAAFEDESGGKGGTESGELRRRKECVGYSGGMKECKRAVRGGSLRRGNRSLGGLRFGERGLGRMRAGCGAWSECGSTSRGG